MSWNFAMNRLFNDDKSFFVTVQSECNELMCEHFPHIWQRIH